MGEPKWPWKGKNAGGRVGTSPEPQQSVVLHLASGDGAGRRKDPPQQDLKSDHGFPGQYKPLINMGCAGFGDPTGCWSSLLLAVPLLGSPFSPRAPASDLSSSPTYFLQGPHGSCDFKHIRTFVNPRWHFSPAPALPATPSWTVCGQPWCGDGGDIHISALTTGLTILLPTPATSVPPPRLRGHSPQYPQMRFPTLRPWDGCCPVIHAQLSQPRLTMPLPGPCHTAPRLFLPHVPHLLVQSPSHSLSPTSGRVYPRHFFHNMHHRAWDTLGVPQNPDG